jgi:hypothetical protein
MTEKTKPGLPGGNPLEKPIAVEPFAATLEKHGLGPVAAEGVATEGAQAIAAGIRTNRRRQARREIENSRTPPIWHESLLVNSAARTSPYPAKYPSRNLFAVGTEVPDETGRHGIGDIAGPPFVPSGRIQALNSAPARAILRILPSSIRY